MSINQTIKRLIAQNKSSVKELSSQLGLSDEGLAKMLTRDDYKVSILREISKIYNVDIIYFFTQNNYQDGNSTNKKNTYIQDSQVITGYVSESEVAYNTQNNEVEILREKIKNLEEISQVYKETMNFLKSENQRLQKELIRKQ